MKFSIAIVASMLAGLSTGPQAQITTTVRVPAARASAAASTPVNFSSHKITDFCTTAPRSDWIDEEEMRMLVLHRGYKIKTFKVSKTNCYEVYGFDKANRIVEAYFNPITTRLMLENVAK